ncbi:ATP-binding protein [Massilia sp. MB5]|uniref:hybrid sensor histidine kinase/response regulator n=1 Tax=Massilia sp. MB5 TaxID=2919578 RepID=UPI001F0EA80B|nr:ATP-binding protein [Massilia sp. MB5]UMR32996.1 ATP-binding protein [Massilia sp. MB5]
MNSEAENCETRPDFLAGGGECGARLRSLDWASTSLGRPEHWPASLKAVVRTVLGSRFPMSVYWGPELLTFYNDAFAFTAGSKHPGHLGRPAQEWWSEVWDEMSLIFDFVFTGETYYVENARYATERGHLLTESYFTHCHSPIWSENGEVEGVLLVLTETTRQVLAERALVAMNRSQAFQLELADRMRAMDDGHAITHAATEALGGYLRAARVFYVEIDAHARTGQLVAQWSAPGQSTMPYAARIDDYSPRLLDILRSGQPFVVSDVENDPRTAPHAAAYRELGIGAIVVAPLLRGGQLSCSLHIACGGPREWDRDDVATALDTVQRTWEAVERSRAEAALRLEHENSLRAEAALREADGRKDEFLAMLAHELRNPLAPISTVSDLLQRFHCDEAMVRRSAEVIGRQVRHMASLIDDLLDVSRVAHGKVAIEKAVLDMRDIVADAVEQLRPMLAERRHRFEQQLPEQAVWVEGDRKRLVQVLANLLNNAAKYTPEQGQVELLLATRGENLTLTVNDNGVGMPPELLGRAFELFTQDERTLDRSQGGLGLGLALAKRLVEAHDGSIAAHSDGIGKGSSFIVRLPLARAAAPDAPGGARGPVAAVRPLDILLVDDNVDASDILATMLRKAGHSVRVEHDPQAALVQARLQPPQVCMLDIGLPGMDGNEVARRLRKQVETAQTVLLALTGYGQQRDRDIAFRAGFDYHLVKPLDLARLQAILSELP